MTRIREQRDNSWILFKNSDKQADTHADYNGQITVNGQEFYLNGWIKQGQNGAFLAGTIKPKQRQQQPRVVGGIFDDGIEF